MGKRLEDEAASLLERSGNLSPPVHFAPILRLLGVHRDVCEHMPDGWDEAVMHGRRSWLMHVNAHVPVTRQRFSTAHGLGHIVLHEPDFALMSCHEQAESGIEWEANQFAALLLMPDSWVRSAFERKPDSDTLADRFQVSRQAMRIRLTALGLIEAA